MNKISNWIKGHKKLSIVLGIALGLLIIGGTTAAILILNNQPSETVQVAPKPKPKPAPAPVKYYSPLTGIELKTEAETKQPTTAIMIENSPDARPQSGLKDSGVVFEAIAEGGITRFLVIYQEQKPELIGPVRSLRMYYVDWLAPFNASVAHVGGSAAALTEIRNGQYRDIDQFFNPATYWRATDRYAPHNVYTNFERIDALNAAKGFTTSEFTGFKRATTGKPVETPNATSISVTISSFLYNSSYVYDATTNTYARSQAGAPHTDRESGQITPSSVIVMKAEQNRVFEDGWREQIKVIGSGQAFVFQNGTVHEVTWSKADRFSQITFTDSEGKELPLNPGQTWITAVPTQGGGVSWQ